MDENATRHLPAEFKRTQEFVFEFCKLTEITFEFQDKFVWRNQFQSMLAALHNKLSSGMTLHVQNGVENIHDTHLYNLTFK